MGSLNEGGGFHPRNPLIMPSPSTRLASLNEGGGFHPHNPGWYDTTNDTLKIAQ